MNRTRIEWTDYTLNPVVGCPHGCVYCYARGQAKRMKQRCMLCYEFTPHPHLERLNNRDLNSKKPKKIFLDSMWDWNSEGISEEWILAILDRIKQCPQHTFQILSKRPGRYARFEYPEDVWLGTSIATTSDVYRVNDLLRLNSSNLKFVSIEPLHEEIKFWFSNIDWIIVGAETGRRKDKIVSKKEWIQKIVDNARAEDIPLFIKDRYGLLLHEKINEFP